MKREPIGRKLRFEVFKRDKFTCQYCGAKAPDVILHVDHILPVASGGQKDLLNLITACAGCNMGKGKRLLDDSAEIEKQKKALAELAEKKEQLELMIAWREELTSSDNVIFDYFNKRLKEHAGVVLTELGRKDVKAMLKQFPIEDMLDACDIAVMKRNIDFTRGFIPYIAGICHNKRRARNGEKMHGFKN